MKKFKFSKELRLLTPNEFTFVFKQPQQRAYTSQITILGRLNLLEYPRIGLYITKKYIKQAHERNRIKRLIRESFRLRQHELPNMDFVVIVKTFAANFNNIFFQKKLEILWHRHCYLYHLE